MLVAIALVVYLLAAAALAIPAYYLIPNFLVKRWGVDYRKHQVQGRFVKADPNHGLLVVLGTKKVRAIVGSNYRLFRGDPHETPPPNLTEEEKKNWRLTPENFNAPISLEKDGLWVVPRKPGDPLEIGADLDWFVRILDAWVFEVTGYRMIGSCIADLFSAKLASYDLAREFDSNGNPIKNGDISYYVDLAKQVIRYDVINADTGGMEGIEIAGKRVEYKSAVEVSVHGQITFIVLNLDLAFFGVNKYFQNLQQVVKASIVEAVRSANVDQLRTRDWVKKHIDPAPLLKNGRVPNALKPYYLASLEINKTTVDDMEFHEVWDKARAITGAVQEFGFIITGSRNDAIEFDKEFKDFLAKVQSDLRATAKDIQVAEGRVRVAEHQMAADRHLAEGQAAYSREELGTLAKGAEALMKALGGQPGVVGNVLIAQQHTRGVKEAKGGATVFLGGGNTPQPVIDIGGGKEKDTPPPHTSKK